MPCGDVSRDGAALCNTSRDVLLRTLQSRITRLFVTYSPRGITRLLSQKTRARFKRKEQEKKKPKVLNTRRRSILFVSEKH